MRRAVTVCAVVAVLVLGESLVAPRGPAEDPDELLRQASESLGDGKPFSTAVSLTARAANALERGGDLLGATEARLRLLSDAPSTALVGDPVVVEQTEKLVRGARKLDRKDWLARGLTVRASVALHTGRAGSAAADAREAADLSIELGLPALRAIATVLLQWAEVRSVGVPGCEARVADAIHAMSQQPVSEAEPTGVVALRSLASISLAYDRGDLAQEAALGVAERAQVLQEPQSCEGSYESLGIALGRDLTPESLDTCVGRALEALDRLADPALRARSAVSLAKGAPDHPAIADYLDRMLSGPDTMDPVTAARALACVARARAATGRPEAAAACADRARPALLGSGMAPGQRVWLAADVAWASASSGKSDGSVRLMSSVLGSLPGNAHQARVDCAAQLAQLRWNGVGWSATPGERERVHLQCAADMAGVDADLEQLDTHDPDQVWSMEVATDVLVRVVGDARRAAEVLSRVSEQAAALDRKYTKGRIDLALIEAHLASGEHDEAARLAKAYVEERGLPSQPRAFELIASLTGADEPGQAPPTEVPPGASGLPQP